MIPGIPEWILIIAVCIPGVQCLHHPPEGGWSSKEACLLPAETIIEQAEERLNKNKLLAEEEHRFSWGCVTDEELHRGSFKLTNHKTLGGKWV
jgi:hypothetical protein